MLANGVTYYGHFWNRLLLIDAVYTAILDVNFCAYGINYIWMGALAGRSFGPRSCTTVHHLHLTSKLVYYSWNFQTPSDSDFFIHSRRNSYDVWYRQPSPRILLIWPIVVDSLCFVLSGRRFFGLAFDNQLPWICRHGRRNSWTQKLQRWEEKHSSVQLV